VVRESGVELETPAIMKTVRAALPAHMVPDRIEFIDAIPLGRGVGKVDRETLIAQGSALLQKLGV
jgi:non-ribosomal peptide synthetase component E (peptide arylation enzyme)